MATSSAPLNVPNIALAVAIAAASVPDGNLPYAVPEVGAEDKNIFYPVGIVSGAYFVDGDNGSDANDGIRVQDGGTGPWATLEKATATLQAGDTCYVRQSSTPYRFTGTMLGSTKTVGYRFANSGTTGTYIRVIGYPGEMPVVDQNMVTQGFHFEGNSYIQVLNLEVRNTFGSSMNIASGLGDNDNIVVAFCDLHLVRGASGTNVACVRFDRAVNCTIRENKMHDVRLDDGAGTYILNENACPMVSYKAEACLIENNEMYDARYAIYFKAPNDRGNGLGVLRKNLIYDVVSVFKFNCNSGEEVGTGWIDVYIYQNIAHTPKAGYPEFILDTNEDSPAESHGFYVFNNTTDEYSHAFKGTRDVRWVNNLVLGAGDIILQTTYEPVTLTDPAQWHATIVEADHNFWGNTNGVKVILGTYSGNEKTYLGLTQWRAAPADNDVSLLDDSPAMNSAEGAPLLVDEAGHDYRPDTGSPLIGAGMAGVNIGAFVSKSDQIGVSW